MSDRGDEAGSNQETAPQPTAIRCFVILCGLILLVVNIDRSAVPLGYQILVKVILLMSLAWAVGRIRVRIFKNLRHRPKPFPRHQVAPENVAHLRLRASSSGVDMRQAELFALAATKPRKIRERTVDTFTPGKRHLRQHVSIEAQIPPSLWRQMKNGNRPSAFYFPVIIPIKGKLLDNLQVTDADGSMVSVLSYRESLELAAGILHELLRALENGARQPTSEAFRKAEDVAIEQMIRRRVNGGPILHEHERPGSSFIQQLPATSRQAEKIRSLATQFARMVVENFCIVAKVVPDDTGRIYLNYEQTFIPDLDLTEKATRWSTFVSNLRVAMGARPAEVTIGVQNAMICQSYHLRVVVPDSLYCSEQRALGFDPIIDLRASDTPTKPHLRFARRLGQPYAHFYCRYLPLPPASPNPRTKTQIPRIRFSFAEVPPGSLMRALLAAGAAAVLAWLVGTINSIDPASDTDAPAYLLAFPAIVAAWLGFDAPGPQLFEGTLRARIVLLTTVMTSLLASGLYMAHQTIEPENQGFWPVLPSGISLVGITDLYWALLALLALVNAVYAAYRYYLQIQQFGYFSSREEASNEFDH